MSAALGTELGQRTSVVWLLLVTAAVFTVPGVRMVRRALRERELPTVLVAWAVTGAVVVAVVVTPLVVAHQLHQRHTWVSDEAVTQTRGDDVVARLRFADVEEVRIRYDGGLGAATPEWVNEAVVMVGTDASGERHQVRVSGLMVTSVQPLLRRLAEEVRRRPGLLRTDAERRLFETALAEAD